MTPADRLTRAADALDALADAAEGGRWRIDPDAHLDVMDDKGEIAAFTEVEADARLIALTSSPDTVRLIAAFLRDESAWHEAGHSQDDISPALLALADHVLARVTDAGA